MITSKLMSQLFSQVSDAFDFNSIYRPIQWNPNNVLSERRKAVLRKKQVSLALWLISSLLIVFMLVFLSNIESQTSISTVEAPKTITNPGDEAYLRGDYVKAQEEYRQAIQAGQGTSDMWLNYDRSLLMKTFNDIKTVPNAIQPANSNQIQQGFETLPVNTTPNSEYMTDEEWQQMKENTYNWLGC